MTVLTQAQATTILRNLGWRVRTTSEFHTSSSTSSKDGTSARPSRSRETSVQVQTPPPPSCSARPAERQARKRPPHTSPSKRWLPLWRPVLQLPTHWQKRSAFRMMEGYRSKSGEPLNVQSGCRCPSHNEPNGSTILPPHLTNLV